MKPNIRKMTVAAMFLALSYVLPFLTTGNNPIIASSFSPIHIPVLLCGLCLGWQYGLVVGLLAPLLRFITIHMPPTLVQALRMSAELAAYGCVSGLMMKLFPKKNPVSVYISLICAMLCGRIIWALASMLLYLGGLNKTPMTFELFFTTEFVSQVPAIILHLIIVPLLYFALRRSGVLKEND